MEDSYEKVENKIESGTFIATKYQPTHFPAVVEPNQGSANKILRRQLRHPSV